MEGIRTDNLVDGNYSFYDSNIVLPRVKKLPTENHTEVFPPVIKQQTRINKQKITSSELQVVSSNYNLKGSLRNGSIGLQETLLQSQNFDQRSVEEIIEKEQQFFVPKPPAEPKSQSSRTRSKYSKSSKLNNTYEKPIDPLTTVDQSDKKKKKCKKKIEKESLSNDTDLISLYKDFLNHKFGSDVGSTYDILSSSDSEFSVSSLSGSESDNLTEDEDFNKTLTSSSFQPLYSLPKKDKSIATITSIGRPQHHKNLLNKIVISNSNSSTGVDKNERFLKSGSLPDLRSIENFDLKRVSHVAKNESEAESEPGARIGYKFRPLPPIPGTSSNINSTGLYETIDGFSKESGLNNNKNKKESKHRSFKGIATFLTLIPKLTTNSVRSRKNDHRLADISQYLPDKKLKIFVGTWNMKGTKSLPESLDDFLLPPESVYLQDVYVIGTQEGTPVRREWQVRLQETFGPSHVLMQSSNFGVLQLSVFVRRELVWFCSKVDQDTTATRVGHKIKTKGALAMCFSIFGTSFLFITSHFASNEEKLRDRINDYRSICQNIQLPYANSSKGDEKDVTTRFDRVFWFGDFNFRVTKPRDVVDKMLVKYHNNEELLIKELLLHDQLNNIYKRGKIFHGFTEAPIQFMPTYKFDVNTSRYDTSSKKRVPSWTDRIVHKSTSRNLHSLCYNSCNTIKNSDHRPVYGIFETTIEPYRNNFTVTEAPTFDREVYVEANLRRNAPNGSQENSHICTIL